MNFIQKKTIKIRLNQMCFFVGLLGACPAFSATLLVPHSPKPLWAGTFFSGYIGGAWGHSNVNTDVGVFSETSHFASTANIDAVNQTGSAPLKLNTFIGGIGLSNNWVFQNLIYGFSLDFGSFNLKETNNAVNLNYPAVQGITYSLQTSMDTNWLFTARGRFGFAPVNWPFFYATGGLALTEIFASNGFEDRSNSIVLGRGGSSNNTTRTGWTIGGGLQFPLALNWSLISEYLYVNFGSASVVSSIKSGLDGNTTSTLFTSPFVTSAKLTANIFRVGINYKFA